MAFMDRNNLTALLAALAVVPLYFKEPSQPAPEKWEFASVEIWHSDREVRLESEYLHYSAWESDGKWQAWEVDRLEGTDKMTEYDYVEDVLRIRNSLHTTALKHMQSHSWEPISASPSDLSPYSARSRPSNIYYKRRSG